MQSNQQIKRYWNTRAIERGHRKNATVKDWYLRDLETDVIKRYLKPSDNVLDIGCGNGDPTLKCATAVRYIVGVDYSEKMVEAAKRKLISRRIRNAEFFYADAHHLSYKDDEFDTVIMSRLLINLPNIASKHKVIDEVARVIKKNGLCLLLEATIQGHKSTNRIRRGFGLPNLRKHWHNTYVDEEEMTAYLSRYFTIITMHRFSMYMFLSKVFYPLLIMPKEPRFLSKANSIAATVSRKTLEIENCPIGHNLLWVLKKT